MRILLTTRGDVNEQRNPIALLDLAAYWRRSGHSVDCYDIRQLRAMSAPHKPYDLVALSVLQTLSEDAPLKDALFLKRKFHSKVVIGGKWTRTIPDQSKDFLSRQGIEVYDGPGEQYFVSQEIDFQSYPAWEQVDFKTLGDVRRDIMSTRGCPYHCAFCHNTEKKISFFSAKRTADNIQLLFNLGADFISFVDDIFTLKPSHMESLYHELKNRGIAIEGRCEFFTHVNYINEKTIPWMQRYKPLRISIGIESGDDRMLKLMGKGFDSATAYEKLKQLYEAVQLPLGNLYLIGFPGETEESLKNTLEFIRKTRSIAGCWISYYQPVRGTSGYKLALERNPKAKTGFRNTTISYVDPNLTKRLLFKYSYMMQDPSTGDTLRSKILYSAINLAPYWLLSTLRTFRQNRRLRAIMN